MKSWLDHWGPGAGTYGVTVLLEEYGGKMKWLHSCSIHFVLGLMLDVSM